GRRLIIEHTRYQPADGIHDYRCGQFAAAEHVVADRNFARHKLLPDSVVNAFVMTANKQQPPPETELVGHSLVKSLAIRREINDLIIRPFVLQRSDGVRQWLRHEDHPGPSAKR